MVAIIVIEMFLNIFNYGSDYRTFVKISNEFPEYLFFNPELPQKYFSDKSVVPSVIPDGFKAVKDSNTFRIFVLGGSTAAGYPYPTNASFPRHLKRRLQLVYPNLNFEVVNLGVSAVNSIFITDIINDVLQQSPDLILVYAGHNEYYGALGAAVSEPIGISPGMILWLRELKTYQLLDNIIKLFTPDQKNDGRTLMAEMAGNNVVPFGSDKFYNGLDQFERNIDYVFSRCEAEKVPVIIGSLTSNLLQSPLDKIINSSSEAAELFNRGIKDLENNFNEGESLLIEAKDKDELRFRAPEVFNEIIYSKAAQYENSVANIDSLFRNNSLNKDVEINLFADHLHPTIDGYFLMSKIFFEAILHKNLIKSEMNERILNLVDRILNQTFPFTGIDSTFAEIKLSILLNSYPFVLNSNTQTVIDNYPLGNKSDSLAMEIITGRIGWDDAHSNMAMYYFNKKDYRGFFNEMMALINDKPFDTQRYLAAANYLKEAQRYDLAYTVISLLHKVKPTVNSIKSLGKLSFLIKNYTRALYFFNQIVDVEKNDVSVFIQAAECNIKTGNFQEARKLLNIAQKMQPGSNQVKNLTDTLNSIDSIRR